MTRADRNLILSLILLGAILIYGAINVIGDLL
jgi:hypothetical protein